MARPKIEASSRPLADVAVYGVQRRREDGRRRPWLVRWAVDGRQRSRAFRTRQEAERFRTALFAAAHAGEVFDPETGEPASWQPLPDQVQTHVWARRWLAEQWPEWAPRTRTSAVEALTRFVPAACSPTAPNPPAGLRRHLTTTLRPGGGEGDSDCERWLERWSLQLGQLTRAQLAAADQRLGVADDGSALGAATAGRYRKVSRACIRRAVELELLASDPWPPAPRGRSRRKATRVSRRVNVRSLPDPDTMRRVIAAIATHQPGSRTYQVMTAVAYFAGLRPSEVVMLRPRALHLPQEGWGRIDVTEADVDFDVAGEPKTGPRSVPIPPELVETLRAWLACHDFAPGDLLFRTRTDRRPTASNWARAFRRALTTCELAPLRVYDCRHAAATTWLRAGVPLGEVARRMGHSVETLVATYVGALDGDEQLANDRIAAALTSAAA
jgi:integrase